MDLVLVSQDFNSKLAKDIEKRVLNWLEGVIVGTKRLPRKTVFKLALDSDFTKEDLQDFLVNCFDDLGGMSSSYINDDFTTYVDDDPEINECADIVFLNQTLSKDPAALDCYREIISNTNDEFVVLYVRKETMR